MIKFKSIIKKRLQSLKCFVKTALMANQLPENSKSNKRVVPHHSIESQSSVDAACSAEGFIPLAARDSQWVGIAFYNPNFRSPLDEEDDFEEFELQSTGSEGPDANAIFMLFPGINKNNSALLSEPDSSSTTEITKLLVGHKANFSHMKTSKKLLPSAESKLTSVKEVPLEEKVATSDTDISTCQTRVQSCSITDAVEKYDDEDEEPDRPTHIKRRKKRSDLKTTIDIQESSRSVFPRNPLRPPNKSKALHVKNKTAYNASGQSDFADDEDTEKTIRKTLNNLKK